MLEREIGGKEQISEMGIERGRERGREKREILLPTLHIYI